MPVNTSITSDQSVIELPPVIVTATPPSGAGANPSDVIGPLGGGPNVLRYPSDLPKYYIKFDVYEYRRENLLEVGTLGNVLNTIALALPSQLVDTTSEDWLDTPIGVGGFAFNQAAIAIRGITVNSMKDLGDAFALSIH
jgi:hypothetical protein